MKQKLQVKKANYEHPVQMLYHIDKKTTERKAAKQDRGKSYHFIALKQ